MQAKTVWEQGSSDPNSADMFAAIRQWWDSLNGQEITWRQRLIPESGNIADQNWEPQRFDETFVMELPEVRGITLYWRKPDSKEERSTTPHKLELDQLQQQLFIYPQSQRGVVIRVALPQVVYQQVKMNQPQLTLLKTEGKSMLILRDESQRLEIRATLSPDQVAQLQQTNLA
jgi:hypothetical protein